MTDTLKAPERIYLIPDAGGGFMWCEDPAPGTGMEPEDAIAYVRAALTQPAAVEDGELRRLMAEATPGPWEMVLSPNGFWAVVNDPFSQNIASNVDGTPVVEPSDARLIVAAVNALPGLLAEMDRMREALSFYAVRGNYSETPLPIGTSQEFRYDPPKAVRDGGKLARAALGEQP